MAPGANPAAIKLSFDGAKSIDLDPAGDLVLTTEVGQTSYPSNADAPDSVNDFNGFLTGKFRLRVKPAIVTAIRPDLNRLV